MITNTLVQALAQARLADLHDQARRNALARAARRARRARRQHATHRATALQAALTQAGVPRRKTSVGTPGRVMRDADINASYCRLLAADEACDAPALAAVAWQIYGQLATTAADLGALRARFRVYAAAPQASGRRRPASRRAQTGADLPCTDDPELFFGESPDDVETAKALCRECPARAACLAGALRRREPWGVRGGELFLRGATVPRKRPRGRPRKTDAAA